MKYIKINRIICHPRYSRSSLRGRRINRIRRIVSPQINTDFLLVETHIIFFYPRFINLKTKTPIPAPTKLASISNHEKDRP